MFDSRMAWFCTIAALSCGGIVWGLLRTNRIITAPFLYAVGMAVVLCPQYYVAVENRWLIPDDAIEVYSTMVVLCSIALYGGYFFPVRKRSTSSSRFVINSERLTIVGTVAALIGSAAYGSLLRMSSFDGWRGTSVYLATIAKCALPGVSLIAVAYFVRPTKTKLLLCVASIIIPAVVVSLLGRRSLTIMLPFVFLAPLVLLRRLRPSRLLVLAGIAVLAIVVYAFPAWRGEFRDRAYSEILADRPVADVLEGVFSGDGRRHLEVLDAMIVMGAHYRTARYDLLLPTVYNSLVNLYVPSALVGVNRKEAMYWGEQGDQWVFGVYGIPVAFYTSKGAYTEVFGGLSFFGCILFVVVGRAFRLLYENAMRGGGRAILTLSLFASFPATLPYGAFVYWIATQLPQVALLLLAIRICVYRVSPDRAEGSPDALETSSSRQAAVPAYDSMWFRPVD